MNVSAKGPGHRQGAASPSPPSTNTSKGDIDKAVHEAEQFAAEDKKQREAADVRNQADQMVFQTEKTLEDMGDKLDAGDKANVESALGKLKETLKGNDTEAIKNATEELTKAFYAVSEKLYQQNGQQAWPRYGRRQLRRRPGRWGTTRAPTWWTRTTPWWMTITSKNDLWSARAGIARLRGVLPVQRLELDMRIEASGQAGRISILMPEVDPAIPHS